MLGADPKSCLREKTQKAVCKLLAFFASLRPQWRTVGQATIPPPRSSIL
jgi:hypothetical protein